MRDEAQIVIHSADTMTKRQRKDIADWLRMHANMLMQQGKDYAPQFIGRYQAEEKPRWR